jgi:hypothetical protein
MDQVDKERRIQLANLLKERKKREREKQTNKQTNSWQRCCVYSTAVPFYPLLT